MRCDERNNLSDSQLLSPLFFSLVFFFEGVPLQTALASLGRDLHCCSRSEAGSSGRRSADVFSFLTLSICFSFYSYSFTFIYILSTILYFPIDSYAND